MTKSAVLIESVSVSTDEHVKLDAFQIFKGASWFGLGTAAGILLEYSTQGLLAAQLGPEDFGTFSVGLQIFMVSLTLALLALPSTMAYIIPGYQTQGEKGRTSLVVVTSFWLNLISSLIVGGTLFLVAEPVAERIFQEAELAIVLQLLAVAVPSSTILALLAGILRGLKLSRQASLLTSTYDRALRFGFIILFLLVGLGLKAPVLAYLPASILALIWGLRYLHRSPARLGLLKPATNVIRDLFQYAGPLLISQVLVETRRAIQPLFLAYFLDTRATGIYAVSLLIGDSPSMVLIAFNFLYLPIVSGISAEGGVVARIQRLYQLIATWGFIIVCPIWLLMVLLPESFLGIFGAQYGEGAWVLRILVTGTLINVGAGAAGTTLLATGQTRTYLFINIFGAILSIGLGLLFIPRLGLIGAATGKVLTVAVWNGLTILFVYKRYHFQPFNRHYIYVVVANLLCLLLLYPIIRLAIGINAWTILGVVPIYAGLSLLMLVRFRLLDADSQAMVGEFLAMVRSRLVLVRSHLFNGLEQ